MTRINTHKPKVTFTEEQRLEYAKLMVDEGYSNKQIMEISNAGDSAVRRWKKQYLDELNGNTPQDKKALTPSNKKHKVLKNNYGEPKGIMKF